ncbi:MAG: sugar phosphate isomerase/epimerase [Anaerolineae bacterium]|nr:sugar phosphate isomerase/epimerase [Anaerolineae bacterium]MDW8099085.1 sugar phosphate isomerase/epimerase [Anaerolineae bacterium]
MSKLPIALQMYTVRDVAEKDFLGTLRQVAQIGYAGVELAGTGDLSARELRAVLDDLGLLVAGSHTPLHTLESDLAGVIEFNQAIGSPHIIIPWVPSERRQTLDGWRQVAASLNEIGQKVRQAGLYLCYHNHAFEFEAFDGKFALDWLYELTDPELVKAELDTYWIQYAGQDPAAYIRKYAHRLGLLHLKDMEPGDEHMFAEVGEGILNWPAIFQAAEASTARWYVVEQDRSRRSSVESARLSFENLKKMGKV